MTVIPVTRHGRLDISGANDVVTAAGPLSDLTLRVTGDKNQLKDLTIKGAEIGGRPAIVDFSGATGTPQLTNAAFQGSNRQEQGVYCDGGSGFVAKGGYIHDIGDMHATGGAQFEDHCFYVKNIPDFLIEHMDLQARAGAAVQLYDGNAVGKIRLSKLHDSIWGIVAWGSGNELWVEDSWIWGSRMIQGGRGYGIQAEGCTVHVKNCHLWDNQAGDWIGTGGGKIVDEGGNVHAKPANFDPAGWPDGSPGPGPTPPPPPTGLDLPGSIILLKDCLDIYFVGQLGYSVARAKKTRVYKALVKEGGTWNGPVRM